MIILNKILSKSLLGYKKSLELLQIFQLLVTQPVANRISRFIFFSIYLGGKIRGETLMSGLILQILPKFA